jgi:hypothetical protein
MNRTLKLPNNPLFKSIIGERKLRAFRRPVDGRLGMLGLSKIVLREAGHLPKRDEAYLFFLSTDKIGQNIVELYGTQAKEMKEELVELG